MKEISTLIDLKESINHKLVTSFPSINLHSKNTEEGFQRFGFFTQIVPLNTEYETVNVTSNKIMVVINYFNENDTELKRLKMYDEIKKAFGMTLKVNQRSFLLKNIRSEIIDEVLQFSFNLDYLVDIGKTDDREDMKDLDMKIEKE